ncbi:hypothetical protein [Deinococcus xinjiangensis]
MKKKWLIRLGYTLVVSGIFGVAYCLVHFDSPAIAKTAAKVKSVRA